MCTLSFSLFLSTKTGPCFCCFLFCCCSCSITVVHSCVQGSFTVRTLSPFRESVLQISCADRRPELPLCQFRFLVSARELAGRQNGHSGIPQRFKLTPRPLLRAEVTQRLLCQWTLEPERNKSTEKQRIWLYIHWPLMERLAQCCGGSIKANSQRHSGPSAQSDEY